MQKTDYIELSAPKTSIFGLTLENANKRLEEAWNELRQKKLALGKPFMISPGKLEMPDGRIVSFDEIYPDNN